MTTTEIRIEGMLKNIEKSKSTLARHQARLEKKTQECKKLGIDDPETWDRYTEGRTNEQYWAKCEYDSVKSDIESTQKKIKEFQERLQFWKDKKKSEDEKNNVPMIPAVEEFLKNWKENAYEYYKQQVNSLVSWSKKYDNYYRKTIKELEKVYGARVHRLDKEVEEIKKSKNVDYKYKEEYIRKNYTQDIVSLSKSRNLDKDLNNMLNQEVQNKRIDLYYRCSAVVGVITDASGLYLGNNGSINGIIIGENGKAKVETIFAGGYNIQCLHYRVLIKPITEKKEPQKSSKMSKKVSSDKNLSYKNKTLQELKEQANQMGIDYKEYSDERITRMRLVMAIKKVKGE